MSLLTPALEARVLQAVEAAGRRAAAPGALRQVRAKGPADYVTNVDLAVQEDLRRRLAELTPAAQFLGEEAAPPALDPARPLWILDPIDGTTNFLHGTGHWAVSLALAEAGQIVFGVVYNPCSGERFTARRGAGAFCGGRPLRVSGCRRLEESLLSVGTVPGRRDLAGRAFARMRTLYDRCQDVRRLGYASLDLCWVAGGRLDGYVEDFLQPWDYAAGLLVVEEAGGRVTAPDGAPLSLTRGGGVLASNGHLHAALQSQLE